MRRYPVAERNGWLFYWPGDPSLADEAQLPDYHKNNEKEDWIRAQGQTYVKAGYRLVLDNLLDLSHLTYVHGSTTGNKAVAELANLTTESGRRFCPGHPLDGRYRTRARVPGIRRL